MGPRGSRLDKLLTFVSAQFETLYQDHEEIIHRNNPLLAFLHGLKYESSDRNHVDAVDPRKYRAPFVRDSVHMAR